MQVRKIAVVATGALATAAAMGSMGSTPAAAAGSPAAAELGDAAAGNVRDLTYHAKHRPSDELARDMVGQWVRMPASPQALDRAAVRTVPLSVSSTPPPAAKPQPKPPAKPKPPKKHDKHHDHDCYDPCGHHGKHHGKDHQGKHHQGKHHRQGPEFAPVTEPAGQLDLLGDLPLSQTLNGVLGGRGELELAPLELLSVDQLLTGQGELELAPLELVPQLLRGLL